MERRFLKVASGLVLALVLILGSGVLMAPPPVWGSGTVNINIVPTSSTVAVGDVFSVNVVLEAGTQPVFGAAAHINFNTTYLEVQSIDKGATLQSTNATSKDFWAACGFDNTAGTIDCSWARSGPVEGLPSGNFTLVTIHLKALAKTDSTSLSFIFNPPLRNTDIMDHSLNSIIGAHSDGGVVIGGAAGTISKIVFTSATQNLAVGQVSAVMTIQTQDSSGSAVNVTSNTTIGLSSNSTGGKFYSDAAGSTQITSVTITSGTSSASFYYKDTAVGTATITAAANSSLGWTAASQPVTVSAGTISKLAFTTVEHIGAQSLTAGVVSAVMTIQTQNAYGVAVNVTSATTINLTSTSTTGKFYSDAAGSNLITAVSISSGANSASFYYKDTKAGTLSAITAAESPSQGWTDASQAENVKAAAASKLVVSGITDPVKAGTACSVTVTAVDAYGNTDTTYAGTIHFTSSDGKATLPADYTFVAATANGSHTFGGVILETAGEQSVTATDTVTSNITGQQTGITVTGGGGTPWGAIIGGIIGGLLLVGIIVYLLGRKKRV